MIVLPFLFFVANNFFDLENKMKDLMDFVTKINIKVITSAILMCIIYMNLIITNVISPYEIESSKLIILVPMGFLIFFLLINNADSISNIIKIIMDTIKNSQSQLLKYGILYFIIFNILHFIIAVI